MPNSLTLLDEYKEMCVEKGPYLDRFCEYSRMSLKYLSASEYLQITIGGSSDQHGWSSLGGELVDFLANKIVMLMYPPGKDFFQIKPTYLAKKELMRLGASESDIELLMADAQAVAKELDDVIDPRVVLIEMMKHLIVGGNALIRFKPSGWELTALTNYVVSKNLAGDIQTLILVERQPIGNYSKEEQKVFKDKYVPARRMDPKQKVDVYTKIKLVEDKYHVTQSIDNSVELKKALKINKDKLPYQAVGWNTVTSPYSSSKFELHAGDFNAMEILKEAIIKGAVIFSDVKTYIDPAAMVDVEELISSEFGSYHYGREGDVTIAQAKNTLGASYVQGMVDALERQLGRAFMFQRAARRDAERVTSFELRIDAIESETSLGGIFTRADKIVMKPYAFYLIANSPAVAIMGDIVPVITTGLNALGKAIDIEKLFQWSEAMQLTNTWPQELIARTNMYQYALYVANRLSLELNFIMDDKAWAELQAQEQAKQQQLIATQEVAKGAGQEVGSQLVQGEVNE